MATDRTGTAFSYDDGRSNESKTRRDMSTLTPTPSPSPTEPSLPPTAVAVCVQSEMPTTKFVLDVHEDKARADVIDHLRYLNGQITHLEGGYDNLGASINTTLNLFVAFQIGLIGALSFCAQQIKESIGCEKWWYLLILSVLLLSILASTVTIIVVLHKFLEQFHQCKRGRQLGQQRDDLVQRCLENERLTMIYRDLLSTYRGNSLFRAAGHTEFSWWSQRLAFLASLIAFSACLSFLFACTRLLCS